MKQKNYYTVFDKNDEIIASGLANECALQMKTNIKSFFSIVSKNKKERDTYKIVIEKVIVNKDNQLLERD